MEAKMNIIKFIEFIQNETQENECLLLSVYQAIMELLDREQKTIDQQIPQLISARDYDKANLYVEMSKTVSEMYMDVDKVANKYGLDRDNMSDEIMVENFDDSDVLVEDDMDSFLEKDTKINYENYRVDENITYELLTDFCHMKPAAFSLDGVRYPARLWKIVLLQTCELLWKKNQSIFENFIDDKFMQGKTRNYFSTDKSGMTKPELVNGTGIYVETNLSANSIRDVIIKMLDKYRIPHAAYQIYLSKDLNPLHTSNGMCDENMLKDGIDENQEEKLQTEQKQEALDMQDYCIDYDYKTQKCMNEKSPYFVMECCKQITCAYISQKPLYVLPKKILKKRHCPQCGNLMEKTIFPVKYEDEEGLQCKNIYGCWCEQCKKAYISEGSYQTFVGNKDLDKIRATFEVIADNSDF